MVACAAVAAVAAVVVAGVVFVAIAVADGRQVHRIEYVVDINACT